MPVDISRSEIEFRFPEVHPDAHMTITFQRTLRVPDDGSAYGLPPGLGAFDLRAVSSLPGATVPSRWSGDDIAMPMWQSEACWLSFTSTTGYPFLLKIGAGEINAVTGDPWTMAPDFAAEDYVDIPTQPWLDGFRVDEGTVRQFVAMPLGQGYTVEEQLSDDTALIGGIQLAVYPLKGGVWAERDQIGPSALVDFCFCPPVGEMGLAAGGTIEQTIATPLEPHDNWDVGARTATTVRMVNSSDWQTMSGRPVHTEPLTIAEYTAHGFPWFQWYDDSLVRRGATRLSDVETVAEIGTEKGEQPLPDNHSFTPPQPIVVGP